MPRARRGGARELPVGKTSATRTDLNLRQPVQVPKGGTYGSGVAAAASQQAMPLPQANALPSAGAPPSPADGTPTAARAMPPSLIGPTRRPDEPVTAGIDSGPGADSSALGLPDADMSRLVGYLPVLEVLAGAPSSTQEMRNFVRLIRANAPTGT